MGSLRRQGCDVKCARALLLAVPRYCSVDSCCALCWLRKHNVVTGPLGRLHASAEAAPVGGGGLTVWHPSLHPVRCG